MRLSSVAILLGVVLAVLTIKVGVLAVSPEELVGDWKSTNKSYQVEIANGELVMHNLTDNETYVAAIYGNRIRFDYDINGQTGSMWADVLLDASGRPTTLEFEHGTTLTRVVSAATDSSVAEAADDTATAEPAEPFGQALALTTFGGGIVDPFDGAPAPYWTWTNEDRSHWSVTADGYLEVQLRQSGGLQAESDVQPAHPTRAGG